MGIVVPIDADVSGLTRKLNGATSSLGGFGKMAAFVAGAAAVGGLVATMKVGVSEFMQAEKVTAQTNAVLKSTGGIANVTKRQVDDLARSIMRKSGMDDEAVKSAENLLLTFTNVRNEAGKNNDVFNQATKITADLSVAFGKDLNSSAILVGKALNDPVKGLSALSRVGIQFTEGQKETIKKLIESGDTMKAQKMILRELETQVGGSAAAYGKTLPGQLDIAKETFRNLAGDLVANFMPTLARAATRVTEFLIQFTNAPTLKAKIELVTGAIGDVWTRVKQWWTTGEVKELPSGIKFTPPGSKQVDDAIKAIKDSMDEKLEKAGNDLGIALAHAIFGGTKTGAKQEGKSAGVDFVKMFVVNVPAIKLGIKFAEWVVDGFEQGLKGDGSERSGGIIESWRDSILEAGLGPLYKLGKELWNQTEEGAKDEARKPRRADTANVFARRLTDQMRSAIQGARQNLAGAASSFGAQLGQIVSANFRVNGTGMNAAESIAEARRLEDRRLEIQEESLKAALEKTTEGTAKRTQAQLDLDEFYFNKGQTLRQRGIDDENAKNQQSIDNLAARFNKGLISAKEFADGLNGIIGEEKGASLGEAFSLGFTNALESLKNTALDIYNIIGKGSPLGPDVGKPGSFNEGGATSAARAQYQQDLADWRELQRLKRALRNAEEKDKAAARRALNAFKREHPDLPDRQPTPQMYGIEKLATGGILTGPRYLAGEAGNEAVIPLGSPTAVDMMRRAFADSVTGGNTVINVEINAGLGTDPAELGREVVKAIKQFERKNGPVFAGA